ncbi:MAG: hypothetical protein E6J21_01530 [Chloroflexota bacterium]|nr:MAG: hypothetical protein E6J21_01530 [Chloroflexota bacterium]
MAYDLEFERPLAELEKKITGLQRKGDRLKHDEHLQLQDAERELRRRTIDHIRRIIFDSFVMTSSSCTGIALLGTTTLSLQDQQNSMGKQ